MTTDTSSMKPSTQKWMPPRWIILIAGTITGTGCGAIYIWSIFNKPLMAMFDYSISEVSLAYSIFLLASCFSSMLAGWLQKRFQYRFIVLAAGILFGAGWFATGQANSLPLLYLTFGVLAGTGNGLLYNTIVAVVTQWFPDKRGMANGFCIGSMGLGPAIFAPIGNMLIESFNVVDAFHIVGIMWVIVYCAFAWLLFTPPDGWQPEGWNPEPADSSTDRTEPMVKPDLKPGQMFRTPLYYVLFLLLMVSATSGLMVTGQASDIGQALAGLTASQGAIMVSMLAVGSFVGRFGFGFLSDKIGRYQALSIALAINAVIMLFVIDKSYSFGMYLLVVCTVGLCFGAAMSIVPTMVADAFGSKHFGQNYSFVYPGYTAASFIGPMLAAFAIESLGSYSVAFLVAGVLAVVGIALAFLGKRLAAHL